MNRIFRAGLLSVLLMLSLSACSNESKTIRAIDAIGTVTMDSLEQIQEADNLYAGLTEEEKAAVTNKDLLDQAKAEYARQKALIQAASDAIDAIGIGPITINTTPTIAQARTAYDAAAPYDINDSLSNQAQVLLDAETQLQQVIGEAELLLSEILSLREAGHYLSIETLAEPYVRYLPEGELKTQLATIVVEALCAEAREQHDRGNSLKAMTALSRCANYASSCSSDAWTACLQLQERYQEALAQNTPSNATILNRTYNAGRNTFTVTVGSSDTCIKLELVNDPEKYVMFYVKANETAKIMLLNGTYRVKYTAGPTWYGEKDMFGPDATYLMLEETVEFSGYTTATHVYWHAINCTLHTGYDDSLGAQNITPEEF